MRAVTVPDAGTLDEARGETTVPARIADPEPSDPAETVTADRVVIPGEDPVARKAGAATSADRADTRSVIIANRPPLPRRLRAGNWK